MKRDWLEKVQNGLVIVLNHLLFIAAVITLIDLFQVESTNMLLWVSTLIIPFLFYCITKIPQKLLPAPMFIVLLGIMSMIEKIMSIHDWENFYFIIALAYLIGYFLFYFLKQYQNFLIVNGNSAANIPEKEMLSNGIKQTFIFGMGSLFVLLMTANIDWFAKIMFWIWNGILNIFRYIISEMAPPMEEEPVKESAQEMATDIGEAVPAEFFPEFVRDIVIASVIIFIFIVFILGCIFMIVLIYQLMKEHLAPYKKIKNEKNSQSNEDIREYCGIEKKVSKKESWFAFLNNREKIRKLYHKKVLKRKQELIGEKEQQQLQYLTAKECCDRLSEPNLKMVYEKARYSTEDITAEEVRLAKKNVK